MAIAEAKACVTPCDPECEKTLPSRVDAAAENAWTYFRSQSTSTLDVVDQVIHLLSGAPGDRVLVMLSSGFLAGGMERETSAITNAALRAHIVISGLDSGDCWATRRNRRNRSARPPGCATSGRGARWASGSCCSAA